MINSPIESLIAHTKPVVLSAVKRHLATGKLEDIDDICQEIYLKLFILSKNNRLDSIQNIEAFIYTLSKNQSISWNRRHKHTVSIDDTDDEIASYPNISPEAHLALREAISIMPSHYKTVLNKLLDGWTLSEISTSLSIGINTVKSQYRRALIILGKILKD